jgi:hypothetical protein
VRNLANFGASWRRCNFAKTPQQIKLSCVTQLDIILQLLCFVTYAECWYSECCFMVSFIMLSVITECYYLECQCSECHFAECRYSEWWYAKYHYIVHFAKCFYTMWHYAIVIFWMPFMLSAIMPSVIIILSFLCAVQAECHFLVQSFCWVSL